MNFKHESGKLGKWNCYSSLGVIYVKRITSKLLCTSYVQAEYEKQLNFHLLEM